MILKPIEHMAWCLLFHWTTLVQAWLSMGHDHFTRLYCCLGHENGCFLSAHLSIDDHAKFCKLPQVLRNSCSAEFSSRISIRLFLQSEQVSPFVSAWLNALSAIVVVCSCDSSIGLLAPCAYWSKVHTTIKIIFSYNAPNCSQMWLWPGRSTLRSGLTSLLTSERGLIEARPGPGARPGSGQLRPVLKC